MRFYGRAEEVTKGLIHLFECGDVPAALAKVFIRRTDDVPCYKWSWSNQLIAAIHGHNDARGFRQWESVGRYVRKGEKGFRILVPLYKRVTDETTGKDENILYGFKDSVVFGYAQTDGKPLERDHATQQFIETLPLVNVARAWGLSVGVFNGAGADMYGFYKKGIGIGLGVKDLQTWCHELIHASEDRLRGVRGGQHQDQEIVAELGGAVLLKMMGLDHAVDLGGTWNYIQHYSKNPVSACMTFINRICGAVNLILSESVRLAGPEDVSGPPVALEESRALVLVGGAL